jgi:predicted DCC family thiol-disulfide oxidoreductase YuxK
MSSATTSSENAAAENSAAISEADRPTNVLFFDGVCGLCNRSVDFVLSRDRRGAIRFAPLQGETAKSVLSSEFRVPSSKTQTFDTIVWLDSSSCEFVRSAAAVRVLWQIGGIWWLIGWLLWLIPRPLRDIGYRIVAANRYRWFGKKETCRLPSPAERSRFLP